MAEKRRSAEQHRRRGRVGELHRGRDASRGAHRCILAAVNIERFYEPYKKAINRPRLDRRARADDARGGSTHDEGFSHDRSRPIATVVLGRSTRGHRNTCVPYRSGVSGREPEGTIISTETLGAYINALIPFRHRDGLNSSNFVASE